MYISLHTQDVTLDGTREIIDVIFPERNDEESANDFRIRCESETIFLVIDNNGKPRFILITDILTIGE